MQSGLQLQRLLTRLGYVVSGMVGRGKEVLTGERQNVGLWLVQASVVHTR